MGHESRLVEIEELANGGDLQLGHMTAETNRFMETFAAFEFESDTFRATELIDHLRCDAAACDEWGADGHAVTFAAKKNFAECDFGIDSRFEFLDVEFVTLFDAVLFTACFDYCVGHSRLGKSCLSAIGAGAESTMNRPTLQEFFECF